MSPPPLRLHIKGDYETTAAEGSKRVPVNEIVPIANTATVEIGNFLYTKNA